MSLGGRLTMDSFNVAVTVFQAVVAASCTTHFGTGLVTRQLMGAVTPRSSLATDAAGR
jgi:hypothetical protein